MQTTTYKGIKNVYVHAVNQVWNWNTLETIIFNNKKEEKPKKNVSL